MPFFEFLMYFQFLCFDVQPSILLMPSHPYCLLSVFLGQGRWLPLCCARCSASWVVSSNLAQVSLWIGVERLTGAVSGLLPLWCHG